MSVTYRIEYDDSPVQAVLNRLIETGQSPRGVMREIAQYGEDSTKRRFAAGQAPDGTAWKPSLRAKKTGTKTLIDTSRLVRSITRESGDDFAEWGSNVIYAAIHQFGGEINKAAQSRMVRHRTDAKGGLLRNKDGLLIFANKKHKRAVTRWFEQGWHTISMPARPYLGINQQDEKNIIDIVNRHLAEAIEI
ncbi:MAG: phage virion morphogenesis protein [Nitrosomonas sp.]|nr:phage virion morphogenesis protein [Nitrosomonas sp.]